MATSINCPHFVHHNTKDLAEAMASPASFKLLYFPLMGRGSTSRDLLSYGGADFESIHPPSWPTDKPNTPFGGLPVLFITGKNGKEVVLSESSIVETYLANLYHLMGDNAYDAAVIRAVHNSAADLQTNMSGTVTFNHPGAKEKCLETFTTATLPNMLCSWERHLVDNGSNGFFFGDRLSLADIRVANILEHLANQPNADDLMAIVAKYPHVFKVRESVANHPKLKAWRQSEGWLTYQKSMRGFMANAGPK
ncbi:hypothetical protein BGZ59_011255 [Podila verticillata]|uniref:Glutathione S-transferase n=1 Tax=Podila verticillata NRRL 6337 TaxID=1069443 RepID=A0A086TM88_9FUNG|nr:hypothetical protein BGZ59_011255 [Podila verticillata]KFH63065.1 hypothetical protein MVEG_11102 [Podila verticillata NRRL 6337]